MKTLSASQITEALETRVKCSFLDASYVLVAEDYLLGKFLSWWHKHKQEVGLSYRPGVGDCDDFADQFAAQLVIAARNLPGPDAVCVATLVVRNITRSLGIGAGPHALNLVGVRGKQSITRWIVIEPQNNLYVDLENYHSADRIRASF